MQPSRFPVPTIGVRLSVVIGLFVVSILTGRDALCGTIHWSGTASTELTVETFQAVVGEEGDISQERLFDTKTISDVLTGGLSKVLEQPWKLTAGVTVEARARAVGELRLKSGGTELNLGVEAFASADAFQGLTFSHGGIASVSAQSGFTDRVRLTGDGILPLDPRLIFKFKVDGVFSPAPKVGSWDLELREGDLRGKAVLEFVGNGASGFVSYEYHRDIDGVETHQRSVSALAGFSALLDGGRLVDFRGKFEAQADSLQFGSMSVGFEHTATFVAVEFADGTTPEERGFTLEFESGLTSPNLVDHGDPSVTPVPEPSSMLLLVCSSGIALVRRLRRT